MSAHKRQHTQHPWLTTQSYAACAPDAPWRNQQAARTLSFLSHLPWHLEHTASADQQLAQQHCQPGCCRSMVAPPPCLPSGMVKPKPLRHVRMLCNAAARSSTPPVHSKLVSCSRLPASHMARASTDSAAGHSAASKRLHSSCSVSMNLMRAACRGSHLRPGPEKTLWCGGVRSCTDGGLQLT
jgi:hypothetical protein